MESPKIKPLGKQPTPPPPPPPPVASPPLPYRGELYLGAGLALFMTFIYAISFYVATPPDPSFPLDPHPTTAVIALASPTILAPAATRTTASTPSPTALAPTATLNPTSTPTRPATATPTTAPTATVEITSTTALATDVLTPTATVELTLTIALTPTVELTPTLEPTATPAEEPTATPTPEPTAEPTATIEPTATPAPAGVLVLLVANQYNGNAAMYVCPKTGVAETGGLVNLGETVEEVLGTSNTGNWFFIRHQGFEGWISKSFVEIQSGDPSTLTNLEPTRGQCP